MTVKVLLIILEFWPPPNLVPGERSCIFRPHYLKKERSCQFIDARFKSIKYPYAFSEVRGFHKKFITLLTPSFTPRPFFTRRPPTNFWWLSWENDRDYDAQIPYHFLFMLVDNVAWYFKFNEKFHLQSAITSKQSLWSIRMNRSLRRGFCPEAVIITT